MQKYVKAIGDERLKKVPDDLDLKPYRDYHDYDLMQRMEKALDRSVAPRALASKALRQELADYLHAFREEHRTEQRRAAARTPAKRARAKRGA